jgi:hypothetical protein
VPLSEEELRLLEQMEQALAQEDPKFASTLRGSQMERTAKVRTMGAAAAFALGIAMFLGGAVTQQIWLAIVGFLVMVPSATFALATWHGRAAHAGGSQQPSPEQQVERAMGLDDPPHRFGVVEGGRSAKRRPRSGRSSAKPPKSPRRARGQGGQGGSFMQRMEQRWERRRQQGY